MLPDKESKRKTTRMIKRFVINVG